MQKVIRFLESHVEWLALGIAAIFLGWTIYTYLIGDPVSRPLEGSTVSPADVDKWIDTHAAQKLRDKMDPNATPPNFTVDRFVDSIKSKIVLEQVKPTELTTTAFDYSPFDVNNMPGITQKMGSPVVQLPTLPPAQALLTAAALDTIAPPQAAGAPAAGAAPAAPGAPAAGKDVRLVVATFTIPWNDLYTQWQSSFGPPKPGQQPRLSPAEFQILAITAYRSEMIGDTWSKDEQIEILNGADLPAYPAALNKNAEAAYQFALAKHPSTIVAPDFPTMSAGVVWKDPIQLLPGATNQPNPANTPDQNGGAMGNRDAAHLKTVNTSNQLDGTLYAQYGGGGYGGGRGGPPTGGRPFGIPSPAFQPPPVNPAEQAPPPPTIIPPAPGTVDPVVKLIASVPNPVPQPAPTAKLNLVAAQAKSPDLYVYIIDQTAEAGKTYRYRITYKTLNPLYNKAPQHAAPAHQAWVTQFDLESKLSNYSPEIEVPKQTWFFCGKSQGPQGTKNTFPFDVFTWTGGKWQKGTFVASLGDPIGGVDSGVDYSTGWTFVDQRNAKTKKLITLVDNEGNVDMRDASQDSSSSDYKKTTQWVEQTKNGPAQQQPNQQFQSPYGGPPSPYGGPPSPYGGPPSPYGGGYVPPQPPRP